MNTDARLILVALSILSVVCGSIFLEILHRRARRPKKQNTVNAVAADMREESLV